MQPPSFLIEVTMELKKRMVLVRKHWQLYLLVLLPLAWIIIYRYIPMAGAQIAFRNFNVIEGQWRSPWVGWANFQRFFSSPSFWRLIRNTLWLSFLGVALGFPAPIILALLLNEVKNQRFKKTVQTVTYAPFFISTVVMVSIIILFLSPRTGAYGYIARFFGSEQPTNLMGVASSFPWVYVLSGIWQGTGYAAIIYLAALAGVNPELYDAARIDGASRIQKIFNIDIPSIMPTIVILLILTSGDLLAIGFEKIYLMQNPLNIATSEVIATYVYKIGLVNANFSFGTAVGLFNSVVSFVLLVIVNWVARRVGETSLW
jgi:putative aldouronate transport system permease protein